MRDQACRTVKESWNLIQRQHRDKHNQIRLQYSETQYQRFVTQRKGNPSRFYFPVHVESPQTVAGSFEAYLTERQKLPLREEEARSTVCLS